MRVAEMQRGEPRRAERAVLLLRVLQDQELDPVVERRDEVADAKGRGFQAMRAVRRGGWGSGGVEGFGGHGRI